MVNAMVGLQLLDDKHKLVMINHKHLWDYFLKFKESFDYEIVELENDTVAGHFIKKTNTTVNLKY